MNQPTETKTGKAMDKPPTEWQRISYHDEVPPLEFRQQIETLNGKEVLRMRPTIEATDDGIRVTERWVEGSGTVLYHYRVEGTFDRDFYPEAATTSAV